MVTLDEPTVEHNQRAAARAYTQVAMRCRPYSIDDKLGVQLVQNGEEEGEVNLLNSDYTTNRFAFTYAWWSAYGFDRHIQSNQVSQFEQNQTEHGQSVQYSADQNLTEYTSGCSVVRVCGNCFPCK